MKLLHVMFLLSVGGLIFLVARPGKELRQAEEAAPYEQVERNVFRIHLEIKNEAEQPIADILWFQKAARVALEQKSPWFNVIEQRISEGEVEGVIQLQSDPIQAEYDAHEILSLQLDDEVR